MPRAEKYLRILLWLIAFHSLVAGILLTGLDEKGIGFFGFSGGSSFFRVQGGVFHLVMCLAYLLAASAPLKNKGLLIFIVSAKFIALAYLLLYYFIVDPILTLLLSGLGDGFMGLLVWLLWRKASSETEKQISG